MKGIQSFKATCREAISNKWTRIRIGIELETSKMNPIFKALQAAKNQAEKAAQFTKKLFY